MNASKENARQAQEDFEFIVARCPEMLTVVAFVREFLKSAERKLPSEAAFANEKARRRIPPKGGSRTAPPKRKS